MANRYWVGGTGNWSDNTNHWSAASGGSPGASLPTSADNVYFDANSFTATGQTVTVDVSGTCNAMDWTGALYNPTFAGTSVNILMYGSLTFIAAMTDSRTSGNCSIVLCNSGTKTIKTNGLTVSGSINIDTAYTAGSYSLSDDLTITGILYTAGASSFNTNSHNITCSSMNISGTKTRTVSLGSSIITCSGSGVWGWYTATTTGLTFSKGTSTIKITGGGTYAFHGGGLTYNNVEFSGNNQVISGSNAFNDLKLTAGKTVKFTAGTTQTVTSLTAIGTSGSLITMQSVTAGSVFTISKSSGTVTVDYCFIKDSTVTGGAVFSATHSANGGNNTGWLGLGPTIPVNIGGVWKSSNSICVNIGGTWKVVNSIYVNIGGIWKSST